MYHWNDADDGRGEILLWLAARMAASAEWNVLQQDNLEDGPSSNPTEHQIRQKRDQERLWTFIIAIHHKWVPEANETYEETWADSV